MIEPFLIKNGIKLRIVQSEVGKCNWKLLLLIGLRRCGFHLSVQNPHTLLPKFFGMYMYMYNQKNIRLTVMNNLLPSNVKMHLKFDLKGSTYKRKVDSLMLYS